MTLLDTLASGALAYLGTVTAIAAAASIPAAISLWRDDTPTRDILGIGDDR